MDAPLLPLCAQDPLPARVAAARPEASGFVTTADELVVALAAREGALVPSTGSVLIVGEGLAAFSALTALVEKGVDAGAAARGTWGRAGAWLWHLAVAAAGLAWRAAM